MAKAVKRHIEDWVFGQKDSLIHDLIEIVNVESVSKPGSATAPFGSGCLQALRTMLDKGASMGLRSHNYDNYVGSLSLSGEELEKPQKVIGIWTHLDVVPAGEGWQYKPYEAVYEDGLVIGRGSQDNKSAAVMGLYLLKAIKELEIPFKHPIVLYLGCSEECGMQDLDYFLEHYPAPGLSLIADCGFPACYGEKGSLSLEISAGQKSRLQVLHLSGGVAHNIIPSEASIHGCLWNEEIRIHTEGRSGHSAFPEGSQNALGLLIKELIDTPQVPPEDKAMLQPFYQLTTSTDGSPAGIAYHDEVLGDFTCCGTILTWEDGIFKLQLDVRYPHSMDPSLIITKLQGFSESQGCTINVQSHLPSFGLSPEDPVVLKLTEVYNRETGGNSKPYSMAGGTYAAKLPRAIPFGIAFPEKKALHRKFSEGHGDYHQPDEAVEVDQILNALVLYLLALMEADEVLE